jgi:hypothetical protein
MYFNVQFITRTKQVMLCRGALLVSEAPVLLAISYAFRTFLTCRSTALHAVAIAL